MSDNRKPRSTAGAWITATLIVAPAFYVLSIGPAVWLHRNGYLNGPAAIVVQSFYFPLEGCRKVKFVGPALNWYVSLWK